MEESEGEWSKGGVPVSAFARELIDALKHNWEEVQENYDDLLESGEYNQDESCCRYYLDEVSCGAIRSCAMNIQDVDGTYRAMCMFVGVPIEIALKHEGVEPVRFFSVYDVRDDLHVYSIAGITDDIGDPRRALVLYFGDCRLEDLWDMWNDHADAVDYAFCVYGEARERLRKFARNGEIPELDFMVVR